MHDTSTDNRRRRGLLGLARRTAASWSERASNEASSALAPAPGVAEEEAGRQRAPEPEKGMAEPSAVLTANSVTPCAKPPADDRSPVEQPSWREPDAPVLPVMNRRRTTEKRDQEKTIRFTPTAVRVISVEAERRGQKFAGFVGDAALAVALGKAGLIGSPEDDPIRPLIEAIEAHTVALNHVGNNLNQITGAIHPRTASTMAPTRMSAGATSAVAANQIQSSGTATAASTR